MLKGSEIKEKSIITIDGKAFFVAFKSKTQNNKETVLTGLFVEEIIKNKYWPIDDPSYEFLKNYLTDEGDSKNSEDLVECYSLTGIEKMKMQVVLINNKLSAIASCLN